MSSPLPFRLLCLHHTIPTMDDFPCEGGDVNISGCKENTKEKINIYRILKTGILITAIAGGEKQ